MRAAVLRGYKEPFAIEDVELAPPETGEVEVRIEAVGICHTDATAREGGKPVPLPIVLGHEGAGVVERVGPGVTSVKPGDRVVIAMLAVCGHCRFCVQGIPGLCRVGGPVLFQGTMLDKTTRLSRGGQPIHHFFAQSSFAERAVVPEGSVAVVPNDAPLDIVSILACGASTGISSVLNTAAVPPGASVVIIGAGGVGLSAVLAAKLAGADPIVVVDVVPQKLGWAKELGATVVINAKDQDPIPAILQHTGGGADYAFEFVGSEVTLTQLVQSIGVGGKGFMIGAGPLGTRFTIDANAFLPGKQLQGVMGGFMRPKIDIPRFVRLFQSGRLPLDRLVTRRLGLEEINEGFDALARGEVIRSVIVMR